MRRLFTHDAGLKILSLCLAVTLWFAVHREEKAVVVVNVPIELHNVPPEMTVVNHTADMVSVRLKGAKSLISGFVPGEIELPQQGKSLRLRPGENYFPIDPKQISVPPGIEVLGVTPSTIRVVLERTAVKEFLIRPTIEDSPPRGFVIRQVTSSPASVVVQGPERELRGITRVTTEPIAVEGKTETFSQLVYLEPPGNHITWSDGEVKQVTVTVEIARREN
jgi:YbbR domain-containing protein